MTDKATTLAHAAREAAGSCALVRDPASFSFLRKAVAAVMTVSGPLSPLALFRILRRVAPYTMVPPIGVAFAAQEAAKAAEGGGQIVECGAWMGGTSFAMALAQRSRFGRVRAPVWMFDSFEGLPQPDARDGEAAFRLMERQPRPLAVPVDTVRALRDALGFGESDAPIVPGWFDQTLPQSVAALRAGGGIALLRLDGDWYESTLTALRTLLPLVRVGGVVIIDDYYAWEGCARAVHEVLAAEPVVPRLRTAPGAAGAWFVRAGG